MSDLKSETSRVNGAKSKGPKTPEGRRSSSLNALKHGLCSSAALLPNESQTRFTAHREGYISRFAPADTVELDLIDQMVAASWRLRRVLAMESIAYVSEMDLQSTETEDQTEDARLYLAMRHLADNSRFSSHLSRHESRINRMYHRALEALQTLQAPKKTCQNEPEPGVV